VHDPTDRRRERASRAVSYLPSILLDDELASLARDPTGGHVQYKQL
jgi:hypothetical protein